MFGAWVILLWFLVVVVFLVKLAPTRRVVSAMRQQPLLVQTVAVLTLGLAVIYGSSKPTNENALVQSPSPLSVNASASLQQAAELSGLPAWWQGSDTDTDDDGIPDQWEKWTHGNRLVADADIDRDADGLTELEEFQNQTDPRTADTDADGFTDCFEIDNGMNPLTKANFIPNEPDINADGIIDLWEGTSYSYGFNDTDHDGFDDSYEAQSLPDATADNFDVLVNVLTTRSALLTWNNTEGSGGLIILPTTGTVVRLRLPFSADTELALSPSPEGTTAPSGELWKSRLRLEFAPRSGQTVRGGVIIAANGDISQKVIEKESTITCFSESSTGQRQTLAQTTTDDTDLKIQIFRRRFAITPELDYFHTTGEFVGPFSITNAVNISTTNFLWRASHGSMMPQTGSSSTLIVTRMPEQDEAIIVTAALELEAGVTNEVSAEARLCPRHVFSVDSCTTNFSPQLGETANISLTLPGCSHANDLGWLEVEIVREVIGVTQHVAWVDMDLTTTNIDRYGDTTQLSSRPSFTWDGIAQASLPLADHPDLFTCTNAVPFHRAMPAISSGKPVPPPFYKVVEKMYNADRTAVLNQASWTIYVPQVVQVKWQSSAEALFRTPKVYAPNSTTSNLVYSAVYAGDSDALMQDTLQRIRAYYPEDVNIRFVPFFSSDIETTKFLFISADIRKEIITDVSGQEQEVYVYGMTSPASLQRSATGLSDNYIGSIYDNTYTLYKNAVERVKPLPFPLPVSSSQMLDAVCRVSAHEVGHALGLVDTTYLDGVGRAHNPGVEDQTKVMNVNTALEWLFKTHSPVGWRTLNSQYLEFVLPVSK